MKLVKKIWDLCATEKGSCLILCALSTIITLFYFALDILPAVFRVIFLVANAALWLFALNIDD